MKERKRANKCTVIQKERKRDNKRATRRKNKKDKKESKKYIIILPTLHTEYL